MHVQLRTRGEYAACLREAISAQVRTFSHAVVTRAEWTRGDAKNSCGVVRLLEGPPTEPAARASYAEVTLTRAILEGPDLVAAVLRELPPTDGEPAHTSWMRSDGAHHVGAREWPTFELREVSRGNGPDFSSGDAVVAFGLPPYASLRDAIRDWLGVRDPYPGAWSIFVPDTRARIREGILLGDGRVEITVEHNLGATDLELHLIHSAGHNEDGAREIVRVEQSVVNATAPSDARYTQMYLVRPGEILDRGRLDRLPREPGTLEPGTLAERCRRELRDGEGEEVEIKPWIGPRESKEHELIETIIAFANTKGGRLYIGADDWGVPQGDGALFKQFPEKVRRGKGKESPQEAARARLRTLVDELPRVPTYTAEVVEFVDARVLCIEVQAGPDGPYGTKDNDVYVRRGASNRRPRLETVSLDTGAAEVFRFRGGVPGV